MPVGTIAEREAGREYLLQELTSRLRVSSADAANIYERMFKTIIEGDEDWYLNIVDNESLAQSEEAGIARSDQRVVVVSIIASDRFSTFTLVKFAEAGQIFYHGAESLPRSRADARSYLRELQRDPEFSTVYESKSFVALEQTGFVSSKNVLIERDAAGMQYLDAGVIPLVKE